MAVSALRLGSSPDTQSTTPIRARLLPIEYSRTFLMYPNADRRSRRALLGKNSPTCERDKPSLFEKRIRSIAPVSTAYQAARSCARGENPPWHPQSADARSSE